MMQAIGDRPAVFVNVKVPLSWEADNNAMLAAQAAGYPNVTLVDWHAYGVAHPALFYDDGVHLRAAGTRAYAEFGGAGARQVGAVGAHVRCSVPNPNQRSQAIKIRGMR